MADYRFVAVDGDTQLGELQALDKRLSLRLFGFSQADFVINGAHPTAEFVRPFDRDVIVYRNDQPIFRGTIGALSHVVDATEHYLNVSVLDYRARLNRRLLQAPFTFTSTRDDAIVEALLDAVQAESSLGITLGTVEAGPQRDFDIDAGVPLFTAINLLAGLDDGFEWYVDAERRLNIYRVRGADRGRVLDYGGAVSRITARVNPTDYGNSVFVTGSRDLTPEIRTDVDPGTQRYDLQKSLLDVQDQPVLAAAADQALVEAKTAFQSYSLALRQSDAVQAWGGLQDVDVGDAVTVHARVGSLFVNSLQRVQEIDITAGNNNDERVILQTDNSAGRFDERIRSIEARLDAVERNV